MNADTITGWTADEIAYRFVMMTLDRGDWINPDNAALTELMTNAGQEPTPELFDEARMVIHRDWT